MYAVLSPLQTNGPPKYLQHSLDSITSITTGSPRLSLLLGLIGSLILGCFFSAVLWKIHLGHFFGKSEKIFIVAPAFVFSMAIWASFSFTSVLLSLYPIDIPSVRTQKGVLVDYGFGALCCSICMSFCVSFVCTFALLPERHFRIWR